MEWDIVNQSHLAQILRSHGITLPPRVSLQTQRLVVELTVGEVSPQYHKIDITPLNAHSFLPYDLLYRIAINIDYDELQNFCLAGKAMYRVWDSASFWFDKITQDFGPSDNKSVWNHKRYFQEAINHHYPIKGIENHVYSYRDLLHLLFNATKLGKSVTRLIDRCDILYQDRYRGLVMHSLDQTLSDMTDSCCPRHQLIHAIVDHRESLSPNPDTSELYFIMQYAILFNNRRVIDHYLKVDPQSYQIGLEIAAIYGTPEMFQFMYNYGNRPYTDYCLLGFALEYGNWPIIKSLLDKGLVLDRTIIKWLIFNMPEILPNMWKSIKLSVEDLNYYLVRIAYTPNLDLAQLLINLGANNLSTALNVAQNNDNAWMVKFLTQLIQKL